MKSRAVPLAGLVAGAVGFVLLGIGLAVAPRRAAFAYLVAFAFALTIALGALFFSMVAQVARATWFVVFHRSIQSVYATLPLFALLFVPIVFGLRQLYPWALPPRVLPMDLREAIEPKRLWLSPGFFVLRAVIYLGVWIAFGELLRRWSLRHDDDPQSTLTRQQRMLSAGGIPPLVLTLTFASFDWFMSLEPAWTSNMYGVYVLAAGFSGACGAAAVLAYTTRTHELEGVVTDDHLHALGKVLLAAVMSWAYIAFVQFLIIWIADLPEEIVWYRSRGLGAWTSVTAVLVLAHFALPFLALLSRDLKRSPRGMAAVGMWLLFAHYVDVYWLLMPALAPSGWRPHWLDLAALLAVCGPVGSLAAWRFRRAPPLPLNDPSLADALRYHAP